MASAVDGPTKKASSSAQAGAAQLSPLAPVTLPAAPVFPGRKLGQYTILEKIGQGGMGSVYKAHDTALDRTVALKVLLAGALDDPKHAQRFLREARSLARLGHPNLLHVYNVGYDSAAGGEGEEQSECYYFAMELLEGETLLSAIRRRGRIPSPELFPYLGQILSALHHVHQQGVTHRDVKSGNIMLCGRRAVLMDFGLAKDETITGLTSVGAVLGTPEYMPPEAAEGKSAGPPTDLYSFGVILYEALSGALPFSGRSAMAIIRQHLELPPPRLEAAVPAIEPALAAIVHKCLAKNPDERFLHCPALAAELLKLQTTPELALLAEEKLTAAPRRPTRVSNAETVRDELTPALGGGLDPTLLAAPAAEAARGETVELDPRGATPRTPDFADAATVVSREPAHSAVTSKQRSRAWTAWLWVAAGFFGVFFLAALLGNLNKRDRRAQLPPPAPTPDQRALLKKTDGSSEEIRWIEFKDGQHVIERRQPGGQWQRATATHGDLIGNGDTLELLHGPSEPRASGSGTGAKP